MWKALPQGQGRPEWCLDGAASQWPLLQAAARREAGGCYVGAWAGSFGERAGSGGSSLGCRHPVGVVELKGGLVPRAGAWLPEIRLEVRVTGSGGAAPYIQQTQQPVTLRSLRESASRSRHPETRRRRSLGVERERDTPEGAAGIARTRSGRFGPVFRSRRRRHHCFRFDAIEQLGNSRQQISLLDFGIDRPQSGAVGPVPAERQKVWNAASGMHYVGRLDARGVPSCSVGRSGEPPPALNYLRDLPL